MKKFNFLWIAQGFALLSALCFSLYNFLDLELVFFALAILLWIGFFVSILRIKLIFLLYLGITLGGFLLFFIWFIFFESSCTNAYTEICIVYLIVIAINTILFLVFSVVQKYRNKDVIEPDKPKKSTMGTF